MNRTIPTGSERGNQYRNIRYVAFTGRYALEDVKHVDYSTLEDAIKARDAREQNQR